MAPSVEHTQAAATGLPAWQGVARRRRTRHGSPYALGATVRPCSPRCAQTHGISSGNQDDAAPVRWLVPGSPTGSPSAPSGVAIVTFVDWYLEEEFFRLWKIFAFWVTFHFSLGVVTFAVLYSLSRK